MFTGIVTNLGVVRRTRDKAGILELEIEAPAIARELKRGDSVAVNGVCLTAIETGRKRFATEAMPETLSRSTLAALAKGASVNLELPARPVDRLGGHIVQGHVDGVATVIRVQDDEGSRRVWLRADADLLRFMVRKGSVTLDGVSLTVVDVGSTSFQIALIPLTLAETTLGALDTGSLANVEVDLIAKYVEKLTKDGR